MKHVLLIMLLLLPRFALSAEDFAISGAGAVSCGKYLDQQKDAMSKGLQITWAQGFLSGMNVADALSGKKLLILPDSETIELYLSNYCKENPLEYPYTGATKLYRELRSRDQTIRKKP